MTFLQMILFYKYLGFSLKTIKELLKKEDGEVLYHLKAQLKLMQKEKQKLLTLIETLEKTIESKERKVSMSTKEKFKGFTYQDNQKYKQAAIDLYGREVIEEAIQKQKGKEQELTNGFNRIFFAFSENKSNGLSATAQENIQLAEELHKHLCRYAFNCPMDVFSSIAYGYVQNKEFKKQLRSVWVWNSTICMRCRPTICKRAIGLKTSFHYFKLRHFFLKNKYGIILYRLGKSYARQ